MPPRRHADDREFHPQDPPAIKLGPDTPLNTDLRTLVTVGASIIAAAIWAWNLYSDVQKLKEDTKEIKTDLAEIRKAVAPSVVKNTLHGPPAPANP